MTDNTPLTDEERRQHRQDGPLVPGGAIRCALCWQPWPCTGATPATLTDEELAALLAEQHHWCKKGQWTDTYGYGKCSCGKDARDEKLSRLIAAFRASRAEVERLEQHHREMHDPLA